MVSYLRYTKYSEDGKTPIEAAWVEIPEERIGEPWEKYVVSRVFGTEAIFAAQRKSLDSQVQ